VDPVAATAASEALVELRGLAERFPIPDGSWHGYVGAMRQVAADLVAALATVEGGEAAFVAALATR